MTHWSLKLLETIKDPNFIVLKTPQLVAIKDKFPKSKHHYLIIPNEDINTIYDLRSQHQDLIHEMDLLALNVIEVKGQKLENFKIGFHAEPSMMRLHLHVISKDFISDCLKTKNHWNSFNTNFLVSTNVILDQLEKHGRVDRNLRNELYPLLSVPLKCNSCDFLALNMPTLKRHLLEHQSS